MYNTYTTADTDVTIDIASQYRRISVPSPKVAEVDWCFNVFYSLEDLRRFDYRCLSEMFIPAECVEEYSMDANTFSSSKLIISGENGIVSFYEFLSRLSSQDICSSTFFRVVLNGMFQVYLRECFGDKTDRRELANEIRKLTELTWFTSKESFYSFVQRACPLIYSQIDRWKLLVELKMLS